MSYRPNHFDCPTTGKRRHATEEDALLHVAEMRAIPSDRHAKGRAPVRAFYCLMCDGWHATGDAKRGRRL